MISPASLADMVDKEVRIMNKKIKTTSTIIVILILSAIALSVILLNRPMKRIINGAPDWAIVYDTFDEAFDASPLAITGKMKSRESYTQNGVLFSTAYFTVENVLKGEYNDDEIAVVYTGGEEDGVLKEVERLRLPEEGEEYFLILRPTDPFEGYLPIAAFQGTYKLEDTSLFSFTRSEELKVEAFNEGNKIESEITGLTPAQIAEKYGA